MFICGTMRRNTVVEFPIIGEWVVKTLELKWGVTRVLLFGVVFFADVIAHALIDRSGGKGITVWFLLAPLLGVFLIFTTAMRIRLHKKGIEAVKNRAREIAAYIDSSRVSGGS